MRYFYDTEFIEDGLTIDLISIGIVAEDGREYYAVNRDAPWKRIAKHGWLMENVVPTLPRLHGDERLHRWILSRAGRRHNPCMLDFAHPHMRDRQRIAREVTDFILPPRTVGSKASDVELWADYCAYDHVVLCQLFGTMMDLPEGMPMWTHDLEQAWELAGRPDRPEQGEGQHNAIEDARWNQALFEVCRVAA
jgi:hypothetical protein